MHLTTSILSELPLGNIEIEPQPHSDEGIFDFTTNQSTVDYSIPLKNDGVLMDVDIEGDFTSFQIFVDESDGSQTGPIKVFTFILNIIQRNFSQK